MRSRATNLTTLTVASAAVLTLLAGCSPASPGTSASSPVETTSADTAGADDTTSDTGGAGPVKELNPDDLCAALKTVDLATLVGTELDDDTHPDEVDDKLVECIVYDTATKPTIRVILQMSTEDPETKYQDFYPPSDGDVAVDGLGDKAVFHVYTGLGYADLGTITGDHYASLNVFQTPERTLANSYPSQDEMVSAMTGILDHLGIQH